MREALRRDVVRILQRIEEEGDAPRCIEQALVRVRAVGSEHGGGYGECVRAGVELAINAMIGPLGDRWDDDLEKVNRVYQLM